MTTTRRIGTMAVMAPRQVTSGFTEATVFHDGPVRLDPLLAITDFHMSEPTFAPHPHAGFSAVTYMLRDSVGSFRNRDSLGDEQLIGPGDLHWTQAAHGMLHEEVPTRPGVDCHGMQLFVNLRAEHEHAPPRAFHVSAGEVPVARPADGVEVRVVAGAAFGARSPLDGLLTPITLLDVDLAAGSSVRVPVAVTDRAVLLVVEGAVDVAGERLPAHAVASLDAPGDAVELTAAEPSVVLLLAGTPIAEPVRFGGPFCMTTDEGLADARRRFAAGEMGRLAPSA